MQQMIKTGIPRLVTCTLCKGTGYTPSNGQCHNPKCPYNNKKKGALK